MQNLTMPTRCKMFVTDFDGTLYCRQNGLSAADCSALQKIRDSNVVTVLATGRSLYSLSMVLSPVSTLPVDFVIFSTGAGLLRVRDMAIIHSANLPGVTVDACISVLDAVRADYMIHGPIPSTQAFHYKRQGNGEGSDTDFMRRVDMYKEHAQPLTAPHTPYETATQVLAVVPATDVDTVRDAIQEGVSECNVIRATSPIDHKSAWLEIFHKSVSKSQTLQLLSKMLNINQSEIWAIGNDYNDDDMLQWAGVGAVVANAPESLKARFIVMPEVGLGVHTFIAPLLTCASGYPHALGQVSVTCGESS